MMTILPFKTSNSTFGLLVIFYLPVRPVGGFSRPVTRRAHLFRSLVKTGYPPRPLTLVPELPFSSLGIKTGDQVIVSEIPGPDPSEGHLGTIPVTTNTPTTFSNDLAQPLSDSAGTLLSGATTLGPDCVDTGDGGVLVHRVCILISHEILSQTSIRR